jgi:hypothetical protein
VLAGHGRVPYGEPRGVEPVEGPDILNPLPHPRGQLGPTPRRIEKIAADMRPTVDTHGLTPVAL